MENLSLKHVYPFTYLGEFTSDFVFVVFSGTETDLAVFSGTETDLAVRILILCLILMILSLQSNCQQVVILLSVFLKIHARPARLTNCQKSLILFVYRSLHV